MVITRKRADGMEGIVAVKRVSVVYLRVDQTLSTTVGTTARIQTTTAYTVNMMVTLLQGIRSLKIVTATLAPPRHRDRRLPQPQL